MPLATSWKTVVRLQFLYCCLVVLSKRPRSRNRVNSSPDSGLSVDV